MSPFKAMRRVHSGWKLSKNVSFFSNADGAQWLKIVKKCLSFSNTNNLYVVTFFETFLKCQSSPIQKCRAIEIFILPVLRSRVWGHFPENQMVRGLI